MNQALSTPSSIVSTERRQALWLAAGAAIAATAATPSGAQTAVPPASPSTMSPPRPSAVLDGRRFDGVFLARGKTSGDADRLIFQGGRFRSTACDRYGYGDAPYRVVADGSAVTFEAETESPKYGKMQWRGRVEGDQLHATAMMLREGKPPLEHWVVAATPATRP